MAARSWATSICVALGVALGVGAAQLGVGYGLNIVAWVPATEDTSRALWLASLAWIAWLTANSTVIGAFCADRLSQRQSEDDAERSNAADLAWRCVIAIAAAIGALITVPLVAVPARFAQQTTNSAPQYTAGGYAVAGVLVGLVAAVGALSVRAIAANVVATASWLWILAIVAVATGLHSGAGKGAAQLATWQFTGVPWVHGIVNLPGALLMLGAALIIGFAAAWFPGRRGDHRVGVAVSGATGPLLVAAAYFLAVPGIGGHDQQLSAYVIAPYAVIAGLAGSVLVSAIGAKGSKERARLQREAQEARDHAEWQRALTAGDEASTTNLTKAKSDRTGSTPRASRGARGTASTGTAASGPTASGPTTGSGTTGSGTTTSTGGARASSPVVAAGGQAAGPNEFGKSPESPDSDLSTKRRRPQSQAKTGLSDDAYAPARAYVTDTVEDEAPAAKGGPTPDREPLWPEETRNSNRRRKGR